jgi:hypothetical protein
MLAIHFRRFHTSKDESNYLIVVHLRLSEVTSSAELIVAVQRLPILRGFSGGAGEAYADRRDATAIALTMVETRSMAQWL